MRTLGSRGRLRVELSRVKAASLFFAALVVAVKGQANDQPPARPTLLTTEGQIHRLSPRQAALAYPIHIRGVVTYYDPYQGLHQGLFVQDATAGLFIGVDFSTILPIHAGSIIEVSGVSDPGGFSPIVAHGQLHITGESASLPNPKQVTLPYLLAGTEDSQWVEMEGIVHSVDYYPKHVAITLATKDGLITATTVREDGGDYAGLVDAEVVVRAVAAPIVDHKGQLTNVRLMLPNLAAITVRQAAAGDRPRDASGMTNAQILRDFSYLSDNDIRACLAFAADRERKLESLTRERRGQVR